MTTEILALPGARTKALLLFVKVSDAHDSTLLLLLVSHTRMQKCTLVYGEMRVCARENAYEPRVGSAKSQQLTHYSRWTQHSHLVRDVGVVIFNTWRSASSCQRLCVGKIEIARRLHVGNWGWRGWVPLVGS